MLLTTRSISESAPETHRWTQVRRLAVILVCSLALFGSPRSSVVASAPRSDSNCVTCLGPQTNTLWQGLPPLGGFSRYGRPLIKNLRTEVLYIYNPIRSGSVALQWPLVKALDAFGTWSGVRPAAQSCTNGVCFDPSFDFSHAAYHSRYAAFVNAPIVVGTSCVQRLPKEAVALLKHERWTLGHELHDPQTCWNPAATVEGGDDAAAPLLLVGGYLQIGIQIVLPSDFEASGAAASSGGLPFSAVHDALAHNAPTSQVTQGTLYAVNAETNLIEAFICHADRMQPHTVCGRPVIKKLLNHVK